MEAATTERPATDRTEDASSFAKSLFLGEIPEEMAFPWPQPKAEEQDRIRALIAAAHAIAGNLDHRKIEEDRWIGDKVIRELGEAGLCGLYVPEQYGGQGLSQTGYARVFETFAQIDSTLSIILGVHQSIGFKAIVMFGSDEQKEHFLPDLATGRKLLLARKKAFPAGRFSALAGFVEPGEMLEDTVIRETREEVGVEIRNIRYFGSQPWPFPGSLMIACIASAESDALNLDSEELEDACAVLEPPSDDVLAVHLRCVDIRGARFRYEYVIERGTEQVATGSTAHALVDRETRTPTRVPPWFAEAVARAESPG
jgi:ADP-ribose pyrophosphatase YjhB (NUDIX family)